jgi:GMP synthase-like glutamine amidotransferase
MKIGLLECDHVNESLRHIAGDYRDMFTSLFARCAPEVELAFFDACNGVLPDSLNDCDGYMTTGSRFSAYDNEPWINDLKVFVRDLRDIEKPFVGICFGHQILAEALGGQVSRVEWGIGAYEMTIKAEQKWMDPRQRSCSILYSHRDQVLRLPQDSVTMAEAAHCPIAIFGVGERMLGIQGHPEFPMAYVEALVRSRTATIGEQQVARADFNSKTDEDVVTRWIAKFFSARSSPEVGLHVR